jgi:hypothetical protein
MRGAFLRCLRRRHRTTAAMITRSAMTPPMVPPAMAPTWESLETGWIDGAAVDVCGIDLVAVRGAI